MSAKQARVCFDRGRRTCIEISRKSGTVNYIPLDILGFNLESIDEVHFDRTYQHVPDYPVEKAARLFAEYAAISGGSPEAMQALASLVSLTPKEIDMATAKKAASAATKATKVAAPKAKAKAAPVAKKVITKAAPAKAVKTAKPKATKKGPPEKEKKVFASVRFRELIKEGKLTDDEIFEAVKKEFPSLEERHRTYVKWYRKEAEEKDNTKYPEVK